jgi:hypothetical protein
MVPTPPCPTRGAPDSSRGGCDPHSFVPPHPTFAHPRPSDGERVKERVFLPINLSLCPSAYLIAMLYFDAGKLAIPTLPSHRK